MPDLFDPKKVSVLLTTYNPAPILDISLTQLSRQNFAEDWELVLCDDGTDFDVFALAKQRFQGTGIPIRHARNSRSGEQLSKCRNNGLRMAMGKTIVMIDGDIAVPRDFLSRHAAHQRAGNTVVFGTRRWVFLSDLPSLPDSAAIERLLADEVDNRYFPELASQRRYSQSDYPWLACYACNLSFRREEEVYFDESFKGWGFEDTEFAVRLKEYHGYTLRFEPSLFGLHLVYESAATVDYLPSSDEKISAMIRNLVYFKNKFPELDMIPSCAHICYYEQDESGRWTRAANPTFNRSAISGLLEKAEQAFGNNSAHAVGAG